MKRKYPTFVLICGLIFVSINITSAQVQVDRDLQMIGGSGERDITGAETVSASVGYLFNGVGTSGQILRSNGTNGFVAAFLQAGDLPSGSGNYIQNQFGVQSGNFNISGTGRAAALQLTDGNTNLSQGSSGALRITTPTGLVDIGAQNASWLHIITDRPRFYFSKGVTVEEGLIGSYDEDLQLQTQGTTRITALNSNGNVGIGTSSPSQKLHISGNSLASGFTAAQQDVYGGQTAGSQSSFGSTWRLGSWQGGTPNTWLYLTNGANTAYHDLAVGNLHVSGTIQGPGAPVGDNLGNHSATTSLNLNANNINSVNDIFCNQNYGRGLVGVYSDTRYQNVFAMGASYRLAADGTTPGNLYGLAWTHSNIGGQSISGLGHQLLAMSNGSTTAAMGNGFWTNYGIQTGSNGTYNRFNTWTDLTGYHGIYSSVHNGAHFYPNNGSYGAWRVDGNRNGWQGIEFAAAGGNITLMTGHTSQGWGSQQTGMHNNSQGWLWRFDHQRLVADGLTDLNDNSYYVDPASTSNVNEQISHTLRTGYLDFRYAGSNSGQGANAYALFQEGGGWSHPYPDLRIAYHTGIKFGANSDYNGMRFYTDYDMSNLVMSINDDDAFGFHNVAIYGLLVASDYYIWSTRERKKDIQKFASDDYESSLAFIDKLNLNYYKYREEADPLNTATQIGFIAEEIPSLLSGPQRNAVSVSNLAILNTGAIKAINKKVEALEKQSRTVSDFGVEQITAAQLWVNFSDDFKAQLIEAQPVVTATPAQPGIAMGISKVTKEGFLVEVAPANSPVNFNWIAMAKVEVPVENAEESYSENFVQMLKSKDEQKPSNELAPKADPELVKERAPFKPIIKTSDNLAFQQKGIPATPVHNPNPVKQEPTVEPK